MKSERNIHRQVYRVKDRLRGGAILMRANSVTGQKWFTIGKPPQRKTVEVDDEVAVRVIAEPDVRGGKDGLWPGCDQTYRIGDPE